LYRYTAVAAVLKRKEEATAAAAAALEEGTQAAAAAAEEEGGDDEGGSPFALPDAVKDYPMWLASLPWYLVFTFTIPPCGGALHVESS
jgi:hypothetical protein